MDFFRKLENAKQAEACLPEISQSRFQFSRRENITADGQQYEELVFTWKDLPYGLPELYGALQTRAAANAKTTLRIEGGYTFRNGQQANFEHTFGHTFAQKTLQVLLAIIAAHLEAEQSAFEATSLGNS